MVEHLHPEDLLSHFREVKRILRPGGKYLIWCPNGLGHHHDRVNHFSMLSYAEWIDKMTEAGFHGFASTLGQRHAFGRRPLQRVLENLLSSLRIKILWSHLGCAMYSCWPGRNRDSRIAVILPVTGASSRPIADRCTS